MDPISLIIAALAAGAMAGVKDTASRAVTDAYTGLKALLRHRFAGNRPAAAALEQAEQQPGSDQAPLAEYLRAAGADHDEELIRTARALLEHADPAGSAAGKYNVRITGGKGIVVGDAANVTMTFNDGD